MAKLLLFRAPVAALNEPLKRARQLLPGYVVTIIGDDQEWGTSDIGPHSKEVRLPGVAVGNIDFLKSNLEPTRFVIGHDDTVRRARRWIAKDWNALLPVYEGVAGQEFEWAVANFNRVNPIRRNPLALR